MEGILSPAAMLSEVDDDARDERKADPCPPKAETDVAETAAKNAAIFMVIASVLKIAIGIFCGLVMVRARMGGSVGLLSVSSYFHRAGAKRSQFELADCGGIKYHYQSAVRAHQLALTVNIFLFIRSNQNRSGEG